MCGSICVSPCLSNFVFAAIISPHVLCKFFFIVISFRKGRGVKIGSICVSPCVYMCFFSEGEGGENWVYMSLQQEGEVGSFALLHAGEHYHYI